MHVTAGVPRYGRQAGQVAVLGGAAEDVQRHLHAAALGGEALVERVLGVAQAGLLRGRARVGWLVTFDRRFQSHDKLAAKGKRLMGAPVPGKLPLGAAMRRQLHSQQHKLGISVPNLFSPPNPTTTSVPNTLTNNIGQHIGKHSEAAHLVRAVQRQVLPLLDLANAQGGRRRLEQQQLAAHVVHGQERGLRETHVNNL